MTSIAVIGNGFVGGNLSQVFAERGLKVFVYDKMGKGAQGVDPFRANSIAGLVAHCEAQKDFSGVFFVCVPTPMLPMGECDLSIVESALTEIALAPSTPRTIRTAVVKSTVPPGSTKHWNQLFEGRLQVVHSPEFLREASALDDMRNQDRIIIGGPTKALEKAYDVFYQAFPKTLILQTDSTTSEMIKYVTNCFLATKVSFANEMYQVCEKLGVDYKEMINIARIDTRLGNSHWQVPGPMPCDATGKPSTGFAGSCFVKDINAFIHLAMGLGVKATMLVAAWSKNLEVRPQRDWEKLKGRAVSEL
jgi:UDPglucose 6-dehydrogenase